MRRYSASWVVFAALIGGCSGVAEVGDDDVSAQSQAQTISSEPPSEASTREPHPLLWEEERPGQPETQPPAPSLYVATCPDEKVARKDWVALANNKTTEKQRAEFARAALPPTPPPQPSEETIAAQQRFLDTLGAKQAEFDALPEESRAQAYADFKQSMMQAATEQSAPTSQGQQRQLQPNLLVSAAGGYQDDVALSPIYSTTSILLANHAYWIQTSNLSAGADTVLHVQDQRGGAANYGHFITGNDDFGGLGSFVSIPAVNYARPVFIVVRDYSAGANHGGTADLTIYDVTTSTQTFQQHITFSGGYRVDFSSFPNGSHFLTTELHPSWLGGAHDTVLLVLAGSADHGLEFDDNGVELMSWIHTDDSCSSNCAVIAGTWQGAAAGTARFIWDEDIHDASKDPDQDGMGDALEYAIGTSHTNADSDYDAIKDGEEFMGIDQADAQGKFLLLFPMYGANPLQRDVFIEADWPVCNHDPSVPNDTHCRTVADPSCGIPDLAENHNLYQLASCTVKSMQDDYFQQYVNIHIDNGVENNDMTTGYLYNKWGGAAAYMNDSNKDQCKWLRPIRKGYFHGVRTGSGSGSTPVLACSSANYKNALTQAHETGHRFKLQHGGGMSGVDLNCKPNYKSIMNYAWSTASQGLKFSTGQYSNITLNPTTMNEQFGFGSTNPDVINTLEHFQFKVDHTTGAVDWNRNGVFESGLVRAAPTWLPGSECEFINYRMDYINSTTDNKYTALSYMPWSSGLSPRLYWFTRNTTTNKIQYRYATTLPTNCLNTNSSTCQLANWYPSYTSPATTLSSSYAGAGAPAAAYLPTGSSYKLLLAYRDSSNYLRYQLLSEVSGQESWTAPQAVGGTAQQIEGSPAAILDSSGDIEVYAISGGVLKRWIYFPGGAWFGPYTETWDDSTTVQASYGIGLTNGYLRTSTGAQQYIFAAIPLPVDSSGESTMELAWRNSSGQWSRLPAANWKDGPLSNQRQKTREQPGLAYVPYDKSADPTNGRFYIAWNPSFKNWPCYVLYMVQTEGNDFSPSASSERLMFTTHRILGDNADTCPTANVTLLFDWAFDDNLRETSTLNNNEARFSPFADGIVPGHLTDQLDYYIMQQDLGCPLGKQPCQH